MREARQIIGHVVAVSGAKLTGTLANLGHITDEDEDHGREAQIGALVKIPTSGSFAFGLVSAVHIPQPSSPPSVTDTCLVDVDLFGEAMMDPASATWRFERGVSIYPGLGEPIFASTSQDLAQIYARPAAANVVIGTLHQDRSLPAYLAPDHLLGKHFAILGTTGCGKSCALALILRAILESYGHGHVLLIDPHAEYAHAFDDMAHVVAPASLHLPYWLLNYEETVAVLCRGDGGRDAEAAILKEALLAARREFLGAAADDTVTVDTPVPYRLSSLIQMIKDAMGKLDRPESALPYLRLLSALESLRRDERYAFMFGGLTARDTMAEVLAELLRLPTGGKPITVFSLAGVPSEIVDVLVSLVCRMVFDFALWSDRTRAAPMLLVCEEAHRYIPRDTAMGFGPTRRAIARIAKEGRKYGVSLGLVTQRPAELAENILSQCNTLFAMRMSSENDQVFVRRAIPENAAGLLNALPALRTQEALVVGEGVSFPMRIRFADLARDHRPHSSSASFTGAWGAQEALGDLLERTIERWRRHGR